MYYKNMGMKRCWAVFPLFFWGLMGVTFPGWAEDNGKLNKPLLEGFGRSRHLYEVLPQSFFPDIKHFEELTSLHEGGVKVPFDERFAFRLNVRGVNLPGKTEEVSLSFGIGYLFGVSQNIKPVSREMPEKGLSSPYKEEHERLFSFLLPSSPGEKGPLLTVTLSFKRGEKALSYNHRKILQGLIEYTQSHPGVMVFIVPEKGQACGERGKAVVDYLVRMGKLKRQNVHLGEEPGGKDNQWMEVKVVEEKS